MRRVKSFFTDIALRIVNEGVIERGTNIGLRIANEGVMGRVVIVKPVRSAVSVGQHSSE